MGSPHRIVNTGPDAVIDAAGALWEVGDAREVDPTDLWVAAQLSIGRLFDAGEPASAAPKTSKGDQ